MATRKFTARRPPTLREWLDALTEQGRQDAEDVDHVKWADEGGKGPREYVDGVGVIPPYNFRRDGGTVLRIARSD